MNDTSTRRSASRDVPGRHGRTSILSCRTDRGTSHAPARAENGAHADEVREAMTETVVVGNASDHGAGETRGWFVGRFLPASMALRRTDAVEVKWGVHPAGESRPAMAIGTA